jgi:hypothetical protein
VTEIRFFPISPTCRTGGERFVYLQNSEDVIGLPILGLAHRKAFLEFLQSSEQYSVHSRGECEQHWISEQIRGEIVYGTIGGIRGGNG